MRIDYSNIEALIKSRNEICYKIERIFLMKCAITQTNQ